MNSQLAHCRRRIVAAIDAEVATGLDPLDVAHVVLDVVLKNRSGFDFEDLIGHSGNSRAAGRRAWQLRQVAHALAGNYGALEMGAMLLNESMRHLPDESTRRRYLQRALTGLTGESR